MTVFSRGNLEIVQVASKEGFDRALNGLRIEPDGSTVASNGRIVVAMSPAARSHASIPRDACEEIEPPGEGLVLSPEFAQKVLKSVPGKSKPAKLQYCALAEVKDQRRVGMTSVDERMEATTHSTLPKPDPYPEWQDVLRDVRKTEPLQVCLNRKDLLELLRTIDAACPSKGETSPLFVEIAQDGSGLLVRARSQETGQHILGALRSLDTKGQWLPQIEWERSVLKTRKARLKKRSR